VESPSQPATSATAFQHAVNLIGRHSLGEYWDLETCVGGEGKYGALWLTVQGSRTTTYEEKDGCERSCLKKANNLICKLAMNPPSSEAVAPIREKKILQFKRDDKKPGWTGARQKGGSVKPALLLIVCPTCSTDQTASRGLNAASAREYPSHSRSDDQGEEENFIVCSSKSRDQLLLDDTSEGGGRGRSTREKETCDII